MATKADILHDSLDAAEDMQAQARDRVREVWAAGLAPMLRDLATIQRSLGDDVDPIVLTEALREAIDEGIDLLFEDVAEALDQVTNDAAKRGHAIGSRLA